MKNKLLLIGLLLSSALPLCAMEPVRWGSDMLKGLRSDDPVSREQVHGRLVHTLSLWNQRYEDGSLTPAGRKKFEGLKKACDRLIQNANDGTQVTNAQVAQLEGQFNQLEQERHSIQQRDLIEALDSHSVGENDGDFNLSNATLNGAMDGLNNPGNKDQEDSDEVLTDALSDMSDDDQTGSGSDSGEKDVEEGDDLADQEISDQLSVTDDDSAGEGQQVGEGLQEDDCPDSAQLPTAEAGESDAPKEDFKDSDGNRVVSDDGGTGDAGEQSNQKDPSLTSSNSEEVQAGDGDLSEDSNGNGDQKGSDDEDQRNPELSGIEPQKTEPKQQTGDDENSGGQKQKPSSKKGFLGKKGSPFSFSRIKLATGGVAIVISVGYGIYRYTVRYTIRKHARGEKTVFERLFAKGKSRFKKLFKRGEKPEVDKAESEVEADQAA